MRAIKRRLKRANKKLRKNARRATARLRATPGFVIVGAAKSGTTSLFDYLAQHPGLSPAKPKEVHFFDRDFDQGERWYRSHFDLKWPMRKVHFEASPSYMFFPFVAERIARHDPTIKIVIILRDPVERAWSHYQHNLRRMERESRPFEDAVAADLGAWDERGFPKAYVVEDRYYSYVRRGIYADQIQPYLEFFGKEKVLVLPSEEMFDDPQKSVDSICEFLDLATYDLKDIRPRNVGLYKESLPMEAELQSFYGPHNERLYEMLGSARWWPYPAANGEEIASARIVNAPTQ